MTICCGKSVGECLTRLYGWRSEDWKIFDTNTGHEIAELKTAALGRVVKFFHPSCRLRKVDLLDMLDELIASSADLS